MPPNRAGVGIPFNDRASGASGPGGGSLGVTASRVGQSRWPPRYCGALSSTSGRVAERTAKECSKRCGSHVAGSKDAGVTTFSGTWADHQAIHVGAAARAAARSAPSRLSAWASAAAVSGASSRVRESAIWAASAVRACRAALSPCAAGDPVGHAQRARKACCTWGFAVSARAQRTPPSSRSRGSAAGSAGSRSTSSSSGPPARSHGCQSLPEPGRQASSRWVEAATSTMAGDPESSPRNSPSCHWRARNHSGSCTRAASPSSMPPSRGVGSNRVMPAPKWTGPSAAGWRADRSDRPDPGCATRPVRGNRVRPRAGLPRTRSGPGRGSPQAAPTGAPARQGG